MQLITAQGGYKFLLLSCVADLRLFNDMSLEQFDQKLTEFFKGPESDVSKQGWGINDASMKLVIKRAELGLTDQAKVYPLIEIDKALDARLARYAHYINKGEQILVNEAGGFQFLTEKFMKTVESVQPYDPNHTKLNSVFMPEGAQYINLENDPFLEQYTRDTLQPLNANFAYIINLRQFSEDELCDAFKAFVAQGGHTVYVYTTGQNVEQMYEYAYAAVRAGVPNLWIQLNSGISDAHRAFAQTVSALSINLRMEAVSAFSHAVA